MCTWFKLLTPPECATVIVNPAAFPAALWGAKPTSDEPGFTTPPGMISCPNCRTSVVRPVTSHDCRNVPYCPAPAAENETEAFTVIVSPLMTPLDCARFTLQRLFPSDPVEPAGSPCTGPNQLSPASLMMRNPPLPSNAPPSRLNSTMQDPAASNDTTFGIGMKKM